MSKQPNRMIILGTACLTALIFHILGIYCLQGSSMALSQTPSTTLSQERKEHEKWIPPEDDPVELQRRQDLVELFTKALYEDSSKEDSLIASIEESKQQVSLPDDQPVPLIADEEHSITSGLEAATAHLDLTQSEVSSLMALSLEPIKETSFHQDTLDQFEGIVLEQLLQATDIPLGQVLVQDIGQLTKEPGLKLGLEESWNQETLDQTLDPLEDVNQEIIDAQYLRQIAKELDFDFHRLAQEGLLTGEAILREVAGAVGAEPGENAKIVEGLLDSKQLGSIASSDHFTSTVRYRKRRGELGYLFKVTLHPKKEVAFRRIKQNMFFLLDRSNSIGRKRFEVSKDAVKTALNHMQHGDSFNILVFDDKVAKLSQSNIEWNEKNIIRANRFLDQQDHGGLFASTDLYGSLDKIIPDAVADNELNTALLFSDGDTFLDKNQQRKTIAAWTQRNQGKVTLYAVATGNSNNLGLLVLLSNFNKGRLLHVEQMDQLLLKLKRLMYEINSPIGKDIVATVVNQQRGPQVQVYPQRSRLPDLYENIPYVIYGSVDRLEDFHLFLQGKYYDQWLDIKQKIKFSEGREGDIALERQWMVQQAYDYYDKYLEDGELASLRQAKKILSSLHQPVAFE